MKSIKLKCVLPDLASRISKSGKSGKLSAGFLWHRHNYFSISSLWFQSLVPVLVSIMFSLRVMPSLSVWEKLAGRRRALLQAIENTLKSEIKIMTDKTLYLSVLGISIAFHKWILLSLHAEWLMGLQPSIFFCKNRTTKLIFLEPVSP